MTLPIASLRAVSVRKPDALILRSVDLELVAGSATAVFGTNGSGKTTLLRVLASLVAPSSGEASVFGVRTDSDRIDDVRPRIGLVGHQPALYENLTLRENLELWAALACAPPGAVDAALDTVGLAGASHRRAVRTSNGMRRRTEFARLLIAEPELLLLDEAHVGLDRSAWELVAHLVEAVTGRGGAAVVVAHEEALVAPLVGASHRLVDGTLVAA
jgi:heme ABC exporter ATP-binding subunit CcmA